MLMALFWWAILLLRNNTTIFNLQQELITVRFMGGEENVDSPKDLPAYKQLHERYQRNANMILGEAIVFGLSLGLGIYLIFRSLSSELFAARKQKNFLLSITHELKSPLASINLILDTFIKRELPHEQIVEFSKGGIEESRRLEDLFNKILMSTRLDTSYVFHFEEGDLSPIIERSLEVFRLKYPNVVIEESIESSLIFKMDAESIKSVLTNLYENAYKYSPKEKYLRVEARKQGDRIKIKICDRGNGIPEKERAHVFEQFYRIGSEETRESKGTGLGLYIVKQIVQAHQGRIKIVSNEPRGSIFEISLPVN